MLTYTSAQANTMNTSIQQQSTQRVLALFFSQNSYILSIESFKYESATKYS